MPLPQDLESWDGKTTYDIETIYERYFRAASFINDIMSSLHTSSSQIGATWLLKKHLETGVVIQREIISELYQLAGHFDNWQSRLHILQCIPMLSIAAVDKSNVEEFLRTCLNDPNKFVRAWAYGGFVELAARFEEYETETRRLITYAMREETPSITARLRNVIKIHRFQ